MNDILLKPCPFCGKDATLEEYGKAKASEGYKFITQVGCKNCNIVIKQDSAFDVVHGEIKWYRNGFKIAVDSWNKREN